MRLGDLYAVGAALSCIPVSSFALSVIVNNDDGLGSANIGDFYRLLNAAGHHAWMLLAVDNESGREGRVSAPPGYFLEWGRWQCKSEITAEVNWARPSKSKLMPVGGPSILLIHTSGVAAEPLPHATFTPLTVLCQIIGNGITPDCLVAGPDFWDSLGRFLYTVVEHNISAIAFLVGNGDHGSNKKIHATTPSGYQRPSCSIVNQLAGEKGDWKYTSPFGSMDPLSVTASIIAVIQVSGAVVSICYDYRNAVKDAVKEATQITSEVKSLQDVLERLLKLVELEIARGSSRLQALQQLVQPDGALPRCQEDLSTLRSKLGPEKITKSLWTTLKWPLTARDLKKTVENISRAKETISLALITDQTALSLAIEDTIDTIAVSQKTFLLDDTRLKIHQWLQPPDPSTNHAAARTKSHAGTGRWLTRDGQYLAWKSDAATFLWLHGIPGCGKTVMCSTVIEDLLSQGRTDSTFVVAYFYFDFHDSTKQSYGNTLRSLVAQVSAQYPETPQVLLGMYHRHSNLGTTQPEHEALLSALRWMISQLGQCYVVLDALDEAHDRDEILDLILLIIAWELPGVHVLVSSRREMDIEAALSPSITHTICMENIFVDTDISEYVQHRLNQDPKLKKWPQSVKDEIQTSLGEKADGMFRWVVCQLDMLRKCVRLPALQAALRSLPRTLDETYSRILAGIDGEYSQDTIRVLRWLAYSARPLRLEEVVEVLAIDWEHEGKPTFDLAFRLPDPLDILTICSSLIVIDRGLGDSETKRASDRKNGAVQGNDRFVRLAHSSVREYLLSDRIEKSAAACYSLADTTSHSFIAQCCLAYLLHFSAPLTFELANAFPLAEYSVRYWIDHFQASEDSEQEKMEDMALALFSSKEIPYASWCRAYNPDKPWQRQGDYGESVSNVSPLYHMSLVGCERLCQRLINAKANPNELGGLLTTPLAAAISQGHEAVAEILLEAGAKADVRVGCDETPLTIAATAGLETTVMRLISGGAEVNRMSHSHGTALACAARNGHDRTVDDLIEAGADAHRYSRKTQEYIPLVEAAASGHERVVRQLLKSALRNEIEESAHVAAHHGHDRIVLLLIETGIRPANALTYAAKIGAKELVSRLIADGQNGGNRTNSDSPANPRLEDPLDAAVKGCHMELVQQLILQGAEITRESLYTAVESGDTRLTELLLHHHSPDEDTMAALLSSAVVKGYKSISGILIDHGANIQCQNEEARPLQIAASTGNSDLVKFFLNKGARINDESEDAGSALQLAAHRGDVPMVQYLIGQGAGVDLCGHKNPTALQNAAKNGHIPVMEILLEAGAILKQYNSHGSILDSAIAGNQPEAVLYLLQCGLNPNEIINTNDDSNQQFLSPLFKATRDGYFQIVKILLENGADPNLLCKIHGRSELPLYVAASKGKLRLLELLLDHGADINAQPEDGFGAIHWAARNGHDEVLQVLLLERGANPRLTLVNGSLALHSAASHGYPKCIKVCLEAGLEVSARNDGGRTALHWAVDKGHQAAAELLLDENVNVDVKEEGTGMTALDYAERKAYEKPNDKACRKMVQLLCSKPKAVRLQASY